MDRPALQRLLADITAGRGEIVVCKIARLSRSLAVAFVALANKASAHPPHQRSRPNITQAILDGRQPPDLTADKLLEHSRLPLAWHVFEHEIG